MDDTPGQDDEVDFDVDPTDAGEASLDDDVTDSDDEEKEPPIEFDEWAPNLVPDFQKTEAGKEELKELAEKVHQDFDTAWESTEAYRERSTNNWKLFAGELPEKDFPWQNAANVNIPILLENITRVTFRAIDELFGDWRNVFGVLPVGGKDDAVARALTLHGNWQIRQQIPDFRRQQHRGVLGFFFNGDVTCHSYYDEGTWLNRHDMLTADEFVVPYRHVTTSPDYSDVPYRVRVIYKHKHELEQMRDVWEGVDDVLEDEPSYDDEPESKMAEEVNKTQGQEMPDDADGAPYKLLWYEGWLELPGQDKARFCKVIYHPGSETILLLAIHEAPDWQDQIRYEGQVQEVLQYQQGLQAHAQMVQQTQMQHTAIAQHVAGMAEQGQLSDQQAQLAGQGLVGLAQQPLPPPPMPPKWMKDPQDLSERPEQVRMRPIHLFAHGVCIEPLVGNLGIGFGRIQADFNRAGNEVLNQFIDAGTLANCGLIITTDTINFKDGFKVAPGKHLKVSGASAQQLKDNLIPFTFPPPSPALLTVAEKVYEWGQSSIQAPNVLSGEPGKSGETARGIAARIEQATKQLSVPTREYASFLTQILKNNAMLNSMYLRDEELIQIVAQQGEPVQEVKITRDMYRRNYQVEIASDLRFTSQAMRVQEADDMLGLLMKVPVAAQNSQLMLAALAKCIEARGKPELLKLLALPPPPPPPSPPQAGPQQGPHPPDGAPPGGPPSQAMRGPPQQPQPPQG